MARPAVTVSASASDTGSPPLERRIAPRRESALVLGVLVACSWAAWLAWDRSGASLDHDTALSSWRDVVLFVAGWLVMVAAMMLPSMTALFSVVGQVARRRHDGTTIQLLVALGFAAVWVVVGLGFRAGDVAIHAVAGMTDGLLDGRVVGTAALLGAGAFQFSSLKYRCLTRCRSPRGLVIRLWSGRRLKADAFHIGSTYGWSCVGCCWALMLVMFGLGAANVVWMVTLGTIMAIEKNGPRSRNLSRSIGLGFVACGLVYFLSG